MTNTIKDIYRNSPNGELYKQLDELNKYEMIELLGILIGRIKYFEFTVIPLQTERPTFWKNLNASDKQAHKVQIQNYLNVPRAGYWWEE